MAASNKIPNADGNWKEKRAFDRVDVTLNTSYRVINLSKPDSGRVGAEKFSIAKNISAGGLVLAVNETIAIGSCVELKIELIDGGKPVECMGRVVRVVRRNEDGGADVGVCFLDLTGEGRKKLDDFVREMSQ